MSSTTALQCAACKLDLVPGAALRVVPLTGNPPAPPFAIHRPNVVAGCLRSAGRTSDATIALYSAPDADAYDRANADGGSRANGPTFEAQARARNAAISAAKPRYELREETTP